MRLEKLNKLRSLSADERRLFVRAVLLLPVIHLALFTLGYYRLYALMERWIRIKPTALPASDREVLERAREIARIVSIAAQHGVYQASCLRRSLLVWWLLRREGVQGKVCFGVRMCDRQLEAHAWVEYKGIVVNDSLQVHERYTALRQALPPTQAGL